jgi:hypothetical protein
MRYTLLLLLAFFVFLSITVSSCAVTRVMYNEQTESEGLLAKVVVLDSDELMELVITMQESGGPIRERVYLVNWMPDYFEIDDYNGDSRPDFRIVSTSNEPHYFYSTAHGFVDI